MFTHPHYNPNSRANDIGVVLLSEPVRKVTPALLPSEFLLDDLDELGLLGNDLVIAGYGKYDWDEIPDGLRRFGLDPIRALRNDVLMLHRDDEAGVTSTDSHDSGSPAYWIDPESGERIIAGVHSSPLGPNQRPYVRADLPGTLAFLDAVLDAVESGEL